MKITLCILTACLISYTSMAQKRLINYVDFGQFNKDLVVNKSTGTNIKMAIWLPDVYWRVVSSVSPNLTQEDAKMIIDALDDYVIISVMEANLNQESTGFDMTSESVLRQRVTLQFEQKTYKPLTTESLSEEVKQFKGIMEPIFTQLLGQFGDGMTVLYFNVKDSKGQNLIDPYKNASFTISLNEDNLVYNLPLPSLYEDKICPTDGAEFPANYFYCPFHGSELGNMGPPPQEELEDVKPMRKD